jgi:hypothetical protein
MQLSEASEPNADSALATETKPKIIIMKGIIGDMRSRALKSTHAKEK